MGNLEQLRQQLDEVNEEILAQLTECANLVKEMESLENLNEKAVIDRLVAINPGAIDNDSIRHLFKQIFQASLGAKEEKKILLVSRKHRNENTVVEVNGIRIGDGQSVVIAGPCSVETATQMDRVASGLQQQGIKLLRGGAYKPRTSPYDFQGLGKPGLELIRKTADKYGMAVISEIVSPIDIEMSLDYVDVIQIGARNMQNFELLKKAGQVRKPVLLKRGLSATIEELLYAAEYIVSRGNGQVMLCERGIRTYEKATRNTLDISAVPILKQESHLPVLVDISHSTGRKDIMLPIAKAALAAGADGIIAEVHPEPQVALSDAKQQLDLNQFANLLAGLRGSGYLSELSRV